MKLLALILLAIISTSAVAPMSLPLIAVHGDQTAAIGELDVCHSGTPAISPTGDMPCMTERCGELVPESTLSFTFSANTLPALNIISARNERPPQA